MLGTKGLRRREWGGKEGSGVRGSARKGQTKQGEPGHKRERIHTDPTVSWSARVICTMIVIQAVNGGGCGTFRVEPYSGWENPSAAAFERKVLPKGLSRGSEGESVRLWTIPTPSPHPLNIYLSPQPELHPSSPNRKGNLPSSWQTKENPSLNTSLPPAHFPVNLVQCVPSSSSHQASSYRC